MLSKTLNRLHSLFSPTGGGVRHRKHSTRRDPAIVEAQALEPRCLLTDQLDFINIEQTGGPWSMETIAIGDQLVYVDYDEQYGHELRIFDPATEESSLFVDVNPGPADSLPRDFLIANNKFFFVAIDREVGLELRWVDLDDVSREVHTVDLTPGLRSSQPNTLMQINDRVFFFANLPEVDSAYTLRWLNTDDPSQVHEVAGATVKPTQLPGRRTAIIEEKLFFIGKTPDNRTQLFWIDANQRTPELSAINLETSGTANPEPGRDSGFFQTDTRLFLTLQLRREGEQCTGSKREIQKQLTR